MAAPRFHHEHVRGQLMREISWTIANRLRDPRVPSIVTVTDIKLSADSRQGTVFVSIFGEESVKKGAVIALNRAAPFIQKTVSQRVSMRHFPKLTFKLDRGIDRSLHISELLDEVKDDLV